MTDEHTGICIYEEGRFGLRETDNAIIDLKGDFPPIMIAPDTVDDGSEPNCANTRSVLHLLNELSDNNQNEERHWYLKKMLDKSWEQYHEQKEENEQLKSTIAQLIEQNRKNNKLLLSDIRILEKALWCSDCENDYGRLKELRKEFMR